MGFSSEPQIENKIRHVLEFSSQALSSAFGKDTAKWLVRIEFVMSLHPYVEAKMTWSCQIIPENVYNAPSVKIHGIYKVSSPSAHEKHFNYFLVR